LDLFILKVLPEGRLEVQILKDLFAPKQGNFAGVLELRILKELAKRRGELLPSKSVSQEGTFVNSKPKSKLEKELRG